MLHDQRLIDLLSGLPQHRFVGEVYRVTRGSLEATTPSSTGGRWAPAAEQQAGFQALYTSLDRDGAIAEVASYLAQLNPVPPEQSLKVSKLAVSTRSTMKIVEANFDLLGIDRARYGERDYFRTQEIGAALIFLEADGLVAPSARWKCENLILFADNHSLSERLEVVETEDVQWRAWAEANGLI